MKLIPADPPPGGAGTNLAVSRAAPDESRLPTSSGPKSPIEGERMRGKSGLRITSVAVLVLFASAAEAATEVAGIKVTNGLILTKCTACHANENGLVARISYQRKTPEGWEETLWRHKRTHGVPITRDEKETLVSYLSGAQGLAPAEVAPYAYTLEKRDTHEKIEGQSIIDTCVRCHSYAKSALQRRTASEWQKLTGMHAGVLPMWLYQLQDVVDWDDTLAASVKELSKRFPLETKEWRTWVASRKKLPVGPYVVSGYEPGKGRYSGEIRIEAAAAGFTYAGQLRYADGGRAEVQGTAVLYGGYAWRGTGTKDGAPTREVLHLTPDGSALSGVRFPAEHHELRGIETMKHAGAAPSLVGAIPPALRAGARDVTVTLLGTSLPAPPAVASTRAVVPAAYQPTDLALGEGITVKRVLAASSTSVTLVVDVRDDAAPGPRKVRAGKATQAGLVSVYKAVDYIKVTPSTAMSRTGGVGLAVKQLVQFEAIAMSNGKDGLPNTADDVEVGRVPASWKLVDLMDANDDEDLPFCGSIDQNGLFTPGADGPNPARKMFENNIGDLWVTASWTPPGGPELSARAYLLSTIPLMIQRPVQ
jgi:quinohemoprotein amine dehydrogenase